MRDRRRKAGVMVQGAARVCRGGPKGLGRVETAAERAGEAHSRRKAGKGRGETGARPHPRPSPPPGFPIWAGAACQQRPHGVCDRRRELTGAGRRGCKGRKGLGAPQEPQARLTRGLRGRRARPARPGPARHSCRCRTAKADQPRPGAGGVGGRVGAPTQGADSRGRRARLPLPVSGPHCRG